MRGEQRPAPVAPVQVLDRGPSDRETVEGGRSPAHFIEDDERPGTRLIEDGSRLHHLDHEGRPAPGQVVRGAHAAEQSVDHTDLGGLGRHVASSLRQHDDQGILAKKGALARHVRTRHQPDSFGIVELTVVGDKRPVDGGFHDRMPAADHPEAGIRVHGGTHVVPLPGDFGKPLGNIEGGQRPGDPLHRLAPGQHLFGEFGEHLLLDGPDTVARQFDPLGERGKFRRHEAGRAGQGLAELESAVRVAGLELLGLAGRHLEEVAQHPVVSDLERVHPRRLALLCLHGSDQPPRLVPKGALLVEVRPEAGPHETAVAHQARRVHFDGTAKQCGEARLPVQRLEDCLQAERQRTFTAHELRPHVRRHSQGVRDMPEVAGPAASEGDARQRSRTVRSPSQV